MFLLSDNLFYHVGALFSVGVLLTWSKLCLVFSGLLTNRFLFVFALTNS